MAFSVVAPGLLGERMTALGVDTPGRFFHLFDPLMHDVGAIRKHVEEILDVGVAPDELDHYVGWIVEIMPVMAEKATGSAARTARIGTIDRTVMARRSLRPDPAPVRVRMAAALETAGPTQKRWRTTREARRQEAGGPDEREQAEKSELER